MNDMVLNGFYLAIHDSDLPLSLKDAFFRLIIAAKNEKRGWKLSPGDRRAVQTLIDNAMARLLIQERK